MFKKTMLTGLAVAGLAFTGAASAVPITGEILINGNVVFDTNSLASATEIVSYGATATAGGTGSYAGVLDLTPVTFTPFQFSPALSPSPVDPLWTFEFGGNTYWFVMDTISILEQTASSLRLEGTGIMYIDGFDPTAGVWAFSSQSAGGATADRFSFSSDTEVVPEVPEPGSLALLGLGLLGLGASRRRKA